MKVCNKLIEESFDYKNNIHGRGLTECIISLDEIYYYVSSVGERLYFDTTDIYSKEIKNGLNSISNFDISAVEIVKNLTILNDEAYGIYSDNKSNIHEAFKILSAKLLECSPDSNHVQYLSFEFIDDEGSRILIECSPHVKLIREDSNLRIYFYWCHDNISKGQKILKGRIGTHPY